MKNKGLSHKNSLDSCSFVCSVLALVWPRIPPRCLPIRSTHCLTFEFTLH